MVMQEEEDFIEYVKGIVKEYHTGNYSTVYSLLQSKYLNTDESFYDMMCYVIFSGRESGKGIEECIIDTMYDTFGGI